MATEGATENEHTEHETTDDVDPAPGGPPRWVLVVGGLAVGLLLGGGLAWWGSRDEDPSPAVDDAALGAEGPVESAEAAEDLVGAWERSRTSTYLSGSLLERTTSTGAVLELPLIVAQRPPERIVSTGASVDGTFDGRHHLCDEQVDGLVRCQGTAATDDYDQQVQAELDTLRSYVEGELPLYRVARDGECFALRLARAIQAPPYGTNARFCFDPQSGAPSLQRIERAEGTDVVTLVSVRTTVDDEVMARVAAGDVDESLLEG